METVAGIICLCVIAWGFMPAARGVAAAIDSVENPTRRETPEEQSRNNSDLVRLLVGLAIVFGVMFVIKMGE